MITSISWVPRGASKPVPCVADPPSKEEIEAILKREASKKTCNEVDDTHEGMDFDESLKDAAVRHAYAVAEEVGRVPSTATGSEDKFHGITDALEELDMDNYDDEDDGIDLFGASISDTYYATNDMDPYITRKDDDDDSEELEDLEIRPDDSVIVCARNEDDVNHLEVWIYEESNDGNPNMYIHHDILISSFPLCTSWLDCPLKGGEKGNFIAVGSMEPAIEIWDLDIMDEVQPVRVLGGFKQRKKGTKKGNKLVKGSHVDAVLGLDWNKEYRNVLASCGADKLVKIWDVVSGKCETTLDHHTDKVQAVAWNHGSAHVLLTGSFDRTVAMKDARAPSKDGYRWHVDADVERVIWDPHGEHGFVVCLENGVVRGYDARSVGESRTSFVLHAHDKAVCSVSYNAAVPNLLATGSMDKMVKLWDVSEGQPKCVVSRNPKLGAVFTLLFSADCPFLLALGGSKGKLDIWDTWGEAEVSKRFGGYTKERA